MSRNPESYSARYDYEEEDLKQDRYMEAQYDLASGAPSVESLDYLLYQHRRENVHEPETTWNAIQDGMEADKLSGKDLDQFIRALGTYSQDIQREILEETDLRRDLALRDDLLMERTDNIRTDLNARAIDHIMQRSTWPGDEQFKDLLRKAERGQWDQIPAILSAYGQTPREGP